MKVICHWIQKVKVALKIGFNKRIAFKSNIIKFYLFNFGKSNAAILPVSGAVAADSKSLSFPNF